MASSEEWRRLAEEIAADGGLRKSKRVARLYQYAVEDGNRVLKHRFRDLSPEDRVDLIHELLATRLERILAADNPRGLFVVALVHDAISLLQWRQRRPHEALDEGITDDASRSRAESAVALGEALQALALFPVAQVRIFVAAAVCGEDRHRLAELHGCSRANVDQIVSRIRRKLRGEN